MTLPPPLADAAARHLVTKELGQTLFVEAGAGSGKTTSLVRRIVSLAASGLPVSQIAAITFTEAAAGELRHRVRDELEREGKERGDQVLINAAGQVESAPITTLHGFALRMLGDHPIEAGLPPGFGVADEVTSMLAFEEGWRLFSGQIGDDLDLLDLQERAALLEVELRRFVDIARAFDSNWDLLESVDSNPAPLSPLDLDPVIGEIAALGGLVEHCLDGADALAKALTDLANNATTQRGLDPFEQLQWLLTLKWPRSNAGRKANWVRLDVESARRQVLECRAGVEQTIEGYRTEVINQFLAMIGAFVETEVGRRRQTGELSFHDLLVLARRVLRSNPTVREQLHQRYTRVLLDEFQDTDPIQIELAVLLAANGVVGERPWQDLAPELEPGRLIVVGDPKQSIYRFRRADIAVYAAAEAALVTETTRLVSNFRSVPAVVNLVNRFFGQVIGDGEPGAQPAYTDLVAVRAPDPETVEDPPVWVIGGPHPKTTPVGEIRELEAADVAALICRAMGEGWRTERNGQWLPLRLQDIAVLIPSRLSLPALEAAFSASNLPFRPETSSLVYATQEVRDVLAGVRAVVDPSNSVDVVAALRSALFALGDDDLLSWHLEGGGWDYERPERTTTGHGGAEHPSVGGAEQVLSGPGGGRSTPSPDHPVAEALAVLRGWHRDRWWLEPSALIERMIIERRLREAALAEPRPRDRWRRYRFLVEQARQFTATTGGDLQDFVAWVEIQSSDMARITEPVPAEPDDDAVRVLTVHGSKGLEFPMVVLAGAPTQEVNRARGPQVLFPSGAAPEVKLMKGRTTPGFDVHASVEEVLDDYERVRLHYVAATRARDILVLSAHHKEGTRSIGLRTWAALVDCEGLWTPFERWGDERYLVEPPTQLRLTAGSYDDLRARWQAEQQVLLDANTANRPWSPTGLVEALGGPPPPAVGPAGGGPAVGTAVHAVLEEIDLINPVGLDLLVERAAAANGVPQSVALVRDLVRAALASPTVALAADHPHWRELYVAAPVAGQLLEGYIDLAIDGPEGLIVVDYKTDLISSADDLEAKVDRYRLQAAAYALLLEHVTGQAPVECRFVFINEDGITERSLADLDGVKAEILHHLGAQQPIG